MTIAALFLWIFQPFYRWPSRASAQVKTMAVDRKKLLRRINFYPPYLGAGIRVRHISDDLRKVEVEMRLRFWNRNYVGTHFGGSLYSMCDPFFMIMLMEDLGPEYIVWDKAATIRFKRPGKGLMTASFEMPAARVDEIRAQAQTQSKVEPLFQTVVRDQDGNVVAEIDKLLYVKKKDKA